jgi:hypothetical protein
MKGLEKCDIASSQFLKTKSLHREALLWGIEFIHHRNRIRLIQLVTRELAVERLVVDLVTVLFCVAQEHLPNCAPASPTANRLEVRSGKTVR